ncbi:MAG: MATE family efflux transporter [Treponema sp.]|nr:MATE family efflux transporter [Treponema sp.]
MGTMPVPKLILNMSLPIMFSMFVQALYNVVDSVFVARINENALTAVSLGFPIQNIMISVGVGTAVGVNALLSMRLGQKDQEQVNKATINGLFLAFCSFFAFFILGFFIIRPYLAGQTDNAEILLFGTQYLNICVFGSFGMFSAIMFDRLLQGTGRTIFSMYSQMSGAITNIIFDPLLIFGLGPVPKMGISGAAFATVLGQWVSMCVSFICNVKINNDVQLKIKGFKPDPTVIAQIYRVGVPSILLGSVGSITIYFINRILGKFSTTAIAVFGVYFKLNSFIFMPVFGLNNGVVPIIAYNYGAENKKRIMQTIRTAMIFAVSIMFFGMILFECFPTQFLRLFKASDAMLAVGVPAMRIIASSFIGAAIAISLTSVFQAFSVATYSMIISFARQLLVLLPAAYILSLSGNVNNVWWAYPIAELVSVILSLIFMMRVYHSKIKKIGDRK